ncbi:MAG: 3-phosphoshikimate 1-carboxyvinyltransferase [Candidatus Thermoplasmatota archaeon]
MMRIEPGLIGGVVAAPPSKSCTHRAYLLASQAERSAHVLHPLIAEDTDATLRGLRALGANGTTEANLVRFEPAPLTIPSAPLFCGNSGTTLRLLAGQAARLATPIQLTGDASLSRRTNGPLLAALAERGVRTASENGRAPLTVQGPLQPGAARLPASVSSQFASSLLLALPFASGPSFVELAAPVDSAPYLDLTHRMARQQGLRIEREATAPGLRFVVEPSRPRGGTIVVEGDWSAAAFLFAAGALTGTTVEVTGLDPTSAQPDRAILDYLRAFGCPTDARSVRPNGPLQSPGTMDVRASPDLFPILAVLAAFANGTTRLVGGTQLRNKESDRIQAMASGLHALGIRSHVEPDGLTVLGGKPQGAHLESQGDHRIHMALAVAALAARGASSVEGDTTVAVSFPRFHHTLVRLGARIFKDGRRMEASP